MAKKLNVLSKIGIALCGVVVFVGIVLLGAIGYFKLSVASYYSASEKAFKIPGLADGFIPQGMKFDEKSQNFFLTGYTSNHTASPVYVVSKDGKTSKCVRLKNADGGDFTGHAGGIGVFGDWVYIADSRGVIVYDYNEILSAKDGDGVKSIGEFSTKATDDDYLKVSFISVANDKIVVGEFYREQNYKTLESHKLTTKAGDYNQALAVEYSLSTTATDTFGIVPTAEKAYSLPDQVQGMTFDGGKVYLSISYGVAFSNILEYDESALVRQDDISVLGETMPLYAMDSASLTKSYKIAPMSEEIVIVDGKLYVMCESASKKYIFGNLTGATWCYKTDLSKVK